MVNVRERLGSGSNTTINNELKAWRQWFLARVSSTTRRPDWPAELGDAMESLWQRACSIAETQLDNVRRETTARADALEAELAARRAELAAQQDALAQLARARQELESALADSQAEVAASLRECETRARAIEAAAAELEREQAARRQDALRAEEERSTENRMGSPAGCGPGRGRTPRNAGLRTAGGACVPCCTSRPSANAANTQQRKTAGASG